MDNPERKEHSTSSPTGFFAKTFAALKHRNYRLFWLGQCVSLIGTWMQNIAQSWLVLEIARKNSALWLGWVSAMQFLPMLILSFHAGILIDRFPKRKVLLITQTVMMGTAFALALDIQLKTVALWHVLIAAFSMGLANTLDAPTRQAYMVELVGRDDLTNAIVLNSSIFNSARLLGPLVAGYTIDSLGTGACFYLNALSFIPVIFGIYLIRQTQPIVSPKKEKTGVWAEIKTGLDFIAKTQKLLLTMILVAVINVFAFNFNIIIPLYAKVVFHSTAQKLGFLMSAIGFGALTAALILAAHGKRKPRSRTIVLGALVFGLFQLAAVPAKNPWAAFPCLFLAGFAMIVFSTSANSFIQLQSPDHLRGRIMSVYTWVFMGLTPIGSFFTGYTAHLWGAPAALGIGSGISVIFILFIIYRYRTILD